MMNVTPDDILAASKFGDDIAAAKMFQLWRAVLSSNAEARKFLTPEQFVSAQKDVALALSDLRAAASDPHEQHILRPCGLFGRVEAEITPLQISLVERLLETHWEFYQSGRLPSPVRQDIFAASREPDANISSRPQHSERLLFAVAKHIHYQPKGVVSDVYLHLPESAAAAGYTVAKFETDKLMPMEFNAASVNGEAIRANEFSKLSGILAEFAPDVVIAEGNFPQHDQYLCAQKWVRLKERFKFKLIIYIGDVDETTGNIVSPWIDVADLMVTFHGPAQPFYKHRNFVVVPGLPFDESAFLSRSTKIQPFFFSGSVQRYRETWLQALAASQFPMEARLHNRIVEQGAYFSDDYYKELAEAKMTFANGWLDSIASITAGRTFEAILSKTLVLEQSGAPTLEYLIPFVHYVPVQNATQLILFARFFNRFEHWRARIADTAFDFYMGNYRSRYHWNFVVNRVMSK